MSEHEQQVQLVLIEALRICAPPMLRKPDELTEREREVVLLALVEALPGREGEVANAALFNLREQRKHQLELAGILEAGRAPLKP